MPGATVWGSTSPLSGPSGRVTVAAGTSTGTLVDQRITSTTVILWSPLSSDVANRYVASCVCSAGLALLTLSGAVTAAQIWGYVIVNNTQQVQ